jgi:opacity protein-like surface antigen
MKRLLIVLSVSAMVFGFGISVSYAAPYFSGNIGAVWVEDSDLTSDQIDNFGGNEADLSFDTGYGATAALGFSSYDSKKRRGRSRRHTYNSGARAEIELGYRKSDMDEISVSGDGSESIDGDFSVLSLMANGFYDFMPSNTFSPFIGGGIGYANVKSKVDGTQKNDNVFAYQLAAGVAIAASQKIKIDLQYRYFVTDDPDLDGVEAEYTAHNLLIGVRYSF